jgi:hypothetical protein
MSPNLKNRHTVNICGDKFKYIKRSYDKKQHDVIKESWVAGVTSLSLATGQTPRILFQFVKTIFCQCSQISVYYFDTVLL